MMTTTYRMEFWATGACVAFLVRRAAEPLDGKHRQDANPSAVTYGGACADGSYGRFCRLT